MRTQLSIAYVLVASCSHAYFRDDFDGTKLDSNKWSPYMECASGIKGTVGGGFYHVTGMHYPHCRETVYLYSLPLQFTPDRFRVSVRVGWEDMLGGFVFGVVQNGVSPVRVANMYAGPGRVGIPNGPEVPAPREGFVTLSIERERRPGNNNYYWFYKDGELIYEVLRTIQRDDIFSLYIGFGASSENDPMSYYVDYAEFVPEPATMSALGVGVAVIARRRGRKRTLDPERDKQGGPDRRG